MTYPSSVLLTLQLWVMIQSLLNLLALFKFSPENNTLLDDHDGFALNPKNLVKNYQDNRSEPKTQRMMFLHMTNHVSTENCVAAKKKNGRFVYLEPSAGLDVAMTEF